MLLGLLKHRTYERSRPCGNTKYGLMETVCMKRTDLNLRKKLVTKLMNMLQTRLRNGKQMAVMMGKRQLISTSLLNTTERRIMTKVKEYSFREFRRLLIDNGYVFLRNAGDHYIFSNGICTISIPDHGKKLNRMVCRRLIKENNLKEFN